MFATNWKTGWNVTLWLSLLVLAATAMQFAMQGGIEGVHAVTRLTARTSLLLFLAAFTASALAQFFPSSMTKWLRKNRRYLGVAFAFSHLVHLIFIFIYAKVDPGTFWASRTPGSLIGPSITYVLIFAMAATSFDRTARVIGAKAWRWLHWLGGYAILFTFMIAYGGRATESAFYIPFFTLLVMALLLRIGARLRQRNVINAAPATE
jgi:methionine sulfoxide reductase heme-binding subunit